MKVVKKKTIRKKLIKAIICTVITAGSMCNAFATVPICAASAIGEFANVVVLVRFKGDKVITEQGSINRITVQ